MCLKADDKSALEQVRELAVSAGLPPKKPLKVLLCSESVPPQVNGIARRVGHYYRGLIDLGCDVDLLCPDSKGVWKHQNPWNFTALMMVLFPGYFLGLMSEDYDILHVVMPSNISGMWLLLGYKMLRLFSKRKTPALVVSWHCNLVDYLEFHFPRFFGVIARIYFDFIFAIFPQVCDRLLTPTRATEPLLTQKFVTGEFERRSVCYTGVEKKNFHPGWKHSALGKSWQVRKDSFLKETNKKHLILCVGRLSPEKGIDELIQTMSLLPDCALWLVGDGPDRPKYEALAQSLDAPVQFLGYQRGEALYSVYTMADCFVCPSTTETFGQIVNEALASEVRVALPAVKVFTEAFGHSLPQDSFWQPMDRQGMATAIMLQLHRHEQNSNFGKPDATKIKSWDDSCSLLLQDYILAQDVAENRPDEGRMTKQTIALVPFLIIGSIFIANWFYLLSLVRGALRGQSLRFYIKTMFIQILQRNNSSATRSK